MNTSLVPVVLPLPPPRAPRSEGVHVSSLIRGLALREGKLKVDAEEMGLVDASQEEWWARLDSVAKLRISLGLAWEEYYIPLLENVTDHPGELCVDGIFMTPDGESLDVVVVQPYLAPVYRELCNHEIKLTYKSVNKVGDIRSQFMWMSQAMAYCKGSGALTTYLHVLFVCGDYSYPIRPRLGPVEGRMYCWRIDFTREEIDQKWADIKNFRDSQEKRGEDIWTTQT